MDRDLHLPAIGRYAVSFLALMLAYTTLAYVGLNWAQVRGAGSPVWPAAGVGLAGLMLGGVRLWPAIVAGRLLAAFLSGSAQPLWADSMIAAGNALATAIPVLILSRIDALEETLCSLRALLRFCLFGGLGQALISATAGSAVLFLSTGLETRSVVDVFLDWSIGVLVGAVTIGPLILAWWGNFGGFTARRWAGFLALTAGTAGFAWLIFTSDQNEYLRTWHILPLLIVSSLAFSVRGTSMALVIIGGIAAWGTSRGLGPFLQMALNPEQQMLLLQQFIGTIALTALILSVVTEERRMKDILAAQQEYLQQAAHDSRARAEELEVILSAVPATVVIAHDPQCRQLSSNHTAAGQLRQYDVMGIGSEGEVRMLDVAGRELRPEERPMQRATRGETLTGFEGRMVFDDGSIRDFLGAARPLLDARGAVRGAVGAFLDVTERKKAEARITLLAREVDHRAKNIMAVVQAMVRLTKAEDIDSFRKAITGRISNLARTHNLLAANRWSGIRLADLVRAEFAAYGFEGDDGSGRSTLDASGPDLELPSDAAQSLALVIHELVTNAVKYGALSVGGGRVGLAWRIEPEAGGKRLHIDWVEEGGPPVSPPQRSGFGSDLITGSIQHQLDGSVEMDWHPDGLRVSLAVLLRD